MLKFDRRGSTITIGLQPMGNSIPASCLMKYVAAVDAKIAGHGMRNEYLRGPNNFRSAGRTGPLIENRNDSLHKQVLRQKGCECHNTLYLNLSTETVKYVYYFVNHDLQLTGNDDNSLLIVKLVEYS